MRRKRLDKLPKRLQREAKHMLESVMNADTREHAEDAIAEFSPKQQRVVDCLEKACEAYLSGHAAASGQAGGTTCDEQAHVALDERFRSMVA